MSSLSETRLAFYAGLLREITEMRDRRMTPARIRCNRDGMLFFKLETGTGAPVEPYRDGSQWSVKVFDLPVLLDYDHEGTPVVETEDGRDARGERKNESR